MLKGKRISAADRADLVHEARAGLIPASDCKSDEEQARVDCAASVIRVVKPRLGSVSRVSDEQAITNILADLRHYCDSKGLPFRKFKATSNALYLEDKRDEVM